MKGYGCFMSSVSTWRKGSCPAGHSLSCIHEFVEIVGFKRPRIDSDFGP
jgi:hypothetical protein